MPNITRTPPGTPVASNTTACTNEILANILEKLDRIDNASVKQNAFMEQQTKTNLEIMAKLDCIPQIAQKVREHDEEIRELRHDVQRLSENLLAQGTSTRPAMSSLTAEIILAGIPSTITSTPLEIAEQIFAALGISNLMSDILSIRVLPKKSNSNIATRDAQGPSTKVETISYIVTLKSTPVRDFIISKKRTKPNLRACDVFANDAPGLIYVNELLPSDIYNLFLRTKAKAAATAHKFVWTRSGLIFVRRDNGQPIIQIKSDADLSKLT